MSTQPAAVAAGRVAPRGPRTLRGARAWRRLTLPVLLLLPALTIIVGAGRLSARRGRSGCRSPTPASATSSTATSTWVGLENYKEVFRDEHLRASLVNTVVFGTACVVGTMVLGLRGRAAAQPAAARQLGVRDRSCCCRGRCPSLAASAIWKWLFDARYGFVNWALVNVGFDSFQDYAWFAGSLQRVVAIFVTVVWQSFPFVALALLAGLQTIPQGDAAGRRGRRRERDPALPAGDAAAAAPDRRRAGDLLDDLGLQDLRPDLRDGRGRAGPRGRHRGGRGLPRGLRAVALRARLAPSRSCCS